MTIVYTILMVLMLVFAGAQYNDPDGIVWGAVYVIPAVLLGLAAFFPHFFATWIGRILLFVVFIAYAVGVFIYWPTQFASFPEAHWWENESIKEGLGMAISYLFISLVVPLAFRRSVRRLKRR